MQIKDKMAVLDHIIEDGNMQIRQSKMVVLDRRREHANQANQR